MPAIALQRCWNHGDREAIARCPECGNSFCRECITEHDERIICASCIKRLSAKPEVRRRSFAPVLRFAAAVVGVLVAWMFFFLIGRMLVDIPADFHEGTVWKNAVFGSERSDE